MRIIAKVILWLVFWPILLPWWSWKRGWIGKIIASGWVLLLLAIGAALQTGEEGNRYEIGQVVPTTAIAQIAAQVTEVVTATSTLAPTATVTSPVQGDDTFIALSTDTSTPESTATFTMAPPTVTPSATPFPTSLPTVTSLPTDTPTATVTPLPTTAPLPTATRTNTPQPMATSTATAAPLPTNTQVPTPTPTDFPSPTPTEMESTMFSSGGLGLIKEEWERGHSQTGTDIFGPIYDDQYIVSFRDNKIWYIELQWSSASAISPHDADNLGGMLIPSDGRLLTVYSPSGRPETTVRLYMSDGLKERFAEDDFVGGEPGNFTVQYNTYESRVTRMIVSLGNNP